MRDSTLLWFQYGNAKLDKRTIKMDLLAGKSCPFAKSCLAWAEYVKAEERMALRRGNESEFTCYAASAEARYKKVFSAHKHNLDLVKGKTELELTRLITESLRAAGPIESWDRCRPHSSGDYFSAPYFRAWCAIARELGEKVFYSYTKALPIWLANRELVPPNFVLTASYGGTHDRLIAEYSLKSAQVVYSRSEAAELGLEIDHDDSNAWRHSRSFALLLHGTQKAGSPAAKALSALRASGERGYSK